MMEEYVALKASAGSGKTFALTVRYISLIFLGAKPHEILTLTFTNKAANEMKERIFHTILNLGEDRAYLEQISLQCGKSIDEIQKEKYKIQQLFISSSLSIFTIDKFINQILKEFSGYLGIFDTYEVKADNIDELSYYFLNSLDEKTFEEFVRIYMSENKKLNSLISLFKFFIQKESSLEFDLKIYDKDISELTSEVFDLASSLKAHIYLTYEEQMGVNAKKSLEFDNLDDLLSKTWIGRESLSEYRDLKKFEDGISSSIFSQIRLKLKEYYKIRSNNSTLAFALLFEKFRKFRQEYIIKKRYLEFNDITNFANKLLSEVIDKDFLYFRLDARYKHILIDEFQDTSVEQFNIILPLIEESLGGNPNDFRTFFYVGDTKQSIYRFRGGKRELFDYVINFYPQIEELNLDTNYRSKKEVVEFVNDTFLKVANYEYINQKSISNGGYVEVVTDIGLDGDSPYSGILEKIKFMRQSGVDLDNLAILVSTNEEVLNLYYYLIESDLNYPITTEMSSKLINQQNVKALINAVKYIFFQENIYKINTLALLGKDTQDSLELDIDIKNISLQKALKDIANSLNITDENIIKLIELSDQFGDIFDFVYDIDNLDASMTSPEKIGISILTIFKSKGLEYESVIVLDKLKRDSHSSEAFLFEYDKIALNHIHYKIKNKELFDEDYAKALLKEAELQRIDTINVLYVALTRAKHNLFVIKKEKNSIFDVLGLGDMQRGKLEASSNAKVSNKDKIQIHYNLINMGIQDIKLKTYSEDFGDLRSKYYGIATHFCLENGQTFHPSEIQTLVDLSKQRFLGILSINDFQQITKSLESLFENNTFKELIKDAKYLKTEQPLIYNGEIKYLDLLIIKENEYIVVDYKTSKTHHDIYIKQVSTYKKAIKKITNNSNIKGYIIYLHPDSTDFYEV